MEEKASDEDVVGRKHRLRYRGVIAKAGFLVFFFGSLGLIYCGYFRNAATVEVAWLVLSICWAVAIRWWMVAGALIGLLCYKPELHGPNIRREVLYAVVGAIAGLACDLIAAFARYCLSRKRRRSEG